MLPDPHGQRPHPQPPSSPPHHDPPRYDLGQRYPYGNLPTVPLPSPPHAHIVRQRPRTKAVPAILLALAMIVMSAAVGAVVFEAGGVRYPAAWDRRVADLAAFVEGARGLEFEHPVHVYFLTPEQYSEVSGGDQPAPTAAERAQSKSSVAQYRALGLMEGEPDLLAASQTLQDSGTLAFYSPVDKVVNVRGTELTVGLRVTLVHELTHALQDQHFDLSPIADAPSADASGAARSVVEGDATAVEDAYVDTLSDTERAEYEAESAGDVDQATDDLGDVPQVLQVLFGSYYQVGSAFVSFMQAAPGEPAPDLDRIDDVLRRLPDRSSQLFEPLTYLEERPAEEVEAPAIPGETELFEMSTFGADFLYVMLSERIDPTIALQATDGIRGDAYRAGRTADGMCVAMRATTATETDRDELAGALQLWAEAMPPSAAVDVSDTEGSSDQVEMRTCDPGADADMALTGAAADALAYPVVRLYLAAARVRGGDTPDAAFCYGRVAVSLVEPADLLGEEVSPALEASMLRAEAMC